MHHPRESTAPRRVGRRPAAGVLRPARAWAVGALLVLATGCFGTGDDDVATCGIPRTTATPGAGLYPEHADTRITLSANRPGATVYFTLDGTVPNREAAHCTQGPTFCGTSPVRNIPIVFDGMVLQYFAVDACGNEEAIQQSTFRLDGAPVTVADPEPGLYNREITIVLTASDESQTPATIYYTRDGSNPEPSNPSTVSGPSPIADIALGNSTQLKWRAIDISGNREDVKQGQYTIDTVAPNSSADPIGGSFDEAVEVTIRIDNDTGQLLYTQSGAVPRLSDPQGHTQTASVQKSLTINRSSYLRFTSVDKAGNTEHADADDPPYNQEVYLIADEPAVIATPPGGEFAETSLNVVVQWSPADAEGTYSLNDGPATALDAGDTVTISGFEAKLEITVDDPTDTIPPRTIREDYVLGAGGVSETFVEDFATTANLDLQASDAEIDTDDGRVGLPTVAVEQSEAATNTAPQSGEAVPWQKRLAQDALVLNQGAVILDGTFTGAGATGGENAPGMKVYTWASDADPAPTFAGGVFNDGTAGNATYHGLTLLRPGVVANPPLAVVASVGGDLLFVDLTSVTNPSVVDTVNLSTQFVPGGTAPPGMAAQRLLTTNAVFVTRRTNDFSFANEIVAFTFDTGTTAAVEEDSVALDAGVAEEIVALALLPGDETQVIALTEDCEVWQVDASPITSMTVVGNDALYTGLCPGAALPNAMTVFQAAGVDYALISYFDAGEGLANATLLSLSTGQNAQGVFGTGTLPADTVWSLDVIAAGDANNRAAVLAGGDALYFYDLSDLTGALTGSGAPFIQRTADPDSFELDAVTVLTPVVPADDVLLTNGWLTTGQAPNIEQFGAIAAWALPDDLRAKAGSAVVQSTDINPMPTSAIRSLKFVSNDFDGSVEFEFSSDGNSFEEISCCQTKTVEPASTEIYWRATLDDSDGDDVELRRVEFRLDYEEEAE